MRKFQGRTRARILCAGFATTATVAAAVAMTASPAFATDQAVTVSPPAGGLSGTITVTYTGFLTSVTTPYATINTGGCTAHYQVPTTGIIGATISKTSADVASITLPAGLTYGTNGASKAYSVCIFDGNTTSDNTVGHGTYTTSPVTPAGGVTGGNATVNSTGTFTGLTTVGGYYSTTACTATYSTSSVTTATVAKNTDDQVSVPVPAALSLNSGAARAYNLCLYNGTTAGTSALLLATTYTLAPAGTLSPASGVSGAGSGTVTVTLPTTSAVLTSASYYAGFNYGGCPSSYTGLLSGMASATVTKVSSTSLTMTVPAGVAGPNGQGYAACIYSASTGDALVATSAVNAFTVSNTGSTLNTAVGAGGTNTLTMSTTNANAFSTATTLGAVFFPQTSATAQYCPGTYTTLGGGTAAQDARKLANNKATLTLPASPLSSGPYSACIYAGTAAGSKMLAVATYTVAAVPTLSSVSPASGPPSGGNVITVSGANLPTTTGSITVSIGNTPVDPTKVTPTDSGTFQFVAPPHPLGASTIIIKTDLGSASLPGAYRYVNSLTVSPNTASNTNSYVPVDVFGSNFYDYDFTLAVSTNVGPHIYLVRGTYDGAGTTGVRANVNVAADCANIAVVSDTELACNLNLTRALFNDGTQAPANGGGRTIALTGGASSKTVTVTGGTTASFSLADIGKPVAAKGGEISAGTIIAQVIDSTTVVLNKVPAGTLTANQTVGYTGTITINSTTAGATTITAAAGSFTQADVGRYLSGSGVTAGTYVTGVNDSGSSATISQGIGGAVTSVATNDTGAVPPGAYNLQFVSDATPGNAYTTSTLSSGSAFTVASF
jgi:hypothetical protein